MQTDKLMILAGDKILKQVGKNLDGIDVTQYADLLFAGAKAEKQRRQLQKQVDEQAKRMVVEINRNIKSEAQIKAVLEICREVSDDWAPEHPPYAAQEMIDRIRKELGDE